VSAEVEVVRAEDVRHVYADGTTLHYRGPPFVVHRGERVALLGPNGSGKTTLLFQLVGLQRPVSGRVRVLGVDPGVDFERVRRRVGVLLQDPDQQIIGPTVRDDIAFSPRNYGVAEPEVTRRVLEVAEALEIDHLLDKVPHYLSGGEKTRVALAGALAVQPEILILDEPFAGLDALGRAELVRLLEALHSRHGASLIVTTHEIDLVSRFADTIYLVARGGEIVLKGNPRGLLAQPEILRRHNLEPPLLSALFEELRRRGIPVQGALTVEEAAEQIARFCSEQTPPP